MALTASQKRQLKSFVATLRSKRRRHTELISVYVPAGYEMSKIIQHLSQEQGTASNIKSTSTRKNVTDALERMIQHLRVYTSTPENGLAVFSGNVAEREGQSDVQVYALEPPVPINLRLYRCDKDFVTGPIEELLDDESVYGMVVMDRRDALIALLKGKSIVPLLKTHSEVPGKFKAGGQSAARFARQREGAAKDHYKKVADYVKDQFLPMENLKGILVGGPGPTKYEFAEGDFITDQVKRKIIAIRDLSYTDEFGLQELLEKSQDVLADEEVAQEKAKLRTFFEFLATEPGRVAYGKQDVKAYLEQGIVDTLLVSETVDDATIEEYERIAEQFSTHVMITSPETREGRQLENIGKVAAILRYEVQQ